MIPSSKVAASISQSAHLWAVSYDDLASAERARHELTRLGGPHQYLILLDTAVVVRDADGSFSLDKKPFAIVSNVLGCTMLGFLAGLVVAAPLTGAAIGAAFGSSGSAVARRIGIIDNHFIQEVNANMKPATSVLFVLEDGGDRAVILHALRGLGGTVLKTNVDAEKLNLVQSMLTG